MTMNDSETDAVEWIREVFLPKRYGQAFRQKNLGLQSRGKTIFHAVSEDGETVAMISTKGGYTSNGKVDTEALMQVRGDALKMLWLEHTPANRFMILTESSMGRVIREEIKKGHFPKEMEILKVKLPATIQQKLEDTRKRGSDSTSLVEPSEGNV
jgi:hypothetical protein